VYNAFVGCTSSMGGLNDSCGDNIVYFIHGGDDLGDCTVLLGRKIQCCVLDT
jgi:hypothetical protein